MIRNSIVNLDKAEIERFASYFYDCFLLYLFTFVGFFDSIDVSSLDGGF